MRQLPLADWEALSLTDRAKLMAAAVRNGYTDIRSIKAAYANFQNQQQTTGNRYAEGGDVNDSDDFEVVNPLNESPVWKALENIDYVAIPDETFTRDKTGQGSIEYFNKDYPEGTTYPNGYHRNHPMPGRDVILYNPNNNDEQDIRLDALHIMEERDPVYKTLNYLYRKKAYEGTENDIAYNAEFWQKVDRGARQLQKLEDKALGKYKQEEDYQIEPFKQYFKNESDGLLRNMLIQGSDQYIKDHGYNPNKQDLIRYNYELMPEINDIKEYLESGQRPSWLLPEVTVTNQKGYGGNLFGYAGKMNQKKQQPIGGVAGFFNLLDKYKIPYIKTSGYRKGAVTKSGHASFHSMLDEWGNAKAQDFKPADGDWDKLRQSIYRNPELVQYMLDNDIGILEENTPDAQKRYGTKSKDGKGVWHAGYDTAAKRNRDNNIKLLQATYHPMQDVTWADVQARKKLFELTPEEERLMSTKPQLVYDADYTDWEDPSSKTTFEQAYAPYALNKGLDNEPSGLEKYIMLVNWPNDSSQIDNSSWFDMAMTFSPKVTPQQQQAANWLFSMTGDGGQLFHGLNFAAYGGKVNKFDGYGNSHLNAVQSSNPRRDGYYIADGAGTRREITYEQALELAKNNPNIVVNYYKDNVGGTGRLHWDESQNQFVDNNEYFGKELDNVDVVKFVNRPTRQLTDAIPIKTPVLEYRPDLVVPVDYTNTDQNMFHRRDVANADAAVREALSSDVVDHIYDYMMPSTWAGAVDKLLDHDENGNLKYNFFTDFNKVFNPTYDNQGFVGLVGADEWADEHPELTAGINTGVDLLLPFGAKGLNWTAKAIGSRYPIIPQSYRYVTGKFKYGWDAQLPTLYRKLKGSNIQTDGKNAIFTNKPSRFRVVETGEDPLITNFTTDMPVLSHGEGNWDIADAYAIPGNTLLGRRVISTRPSDTFTIGDVIKVPKKKVTLITGDPQSIIAAQNTGIDNIISTNKLKEALLRDIADNNAANAGSRFRFHKDDFSRYAREMRNETRANFRRPTPKDYEFMDHVFKPEFTSDVVPLSMRNVYMKSPLTAPDWFMDSYSNSRTRSLLNELDNVFYEPATKAEAQWRRINGIEELKDIPLIIQRQWNK